LIRQPFDWIAADVPGTAAVLDRLLHHSHALVVRGDSYQLKQQKTAGLLSSARKP
jgi:DNA replication protein DnaC